MSRTARVKFPLTVILDKLGLPKGTKIIAADTQYEGRLTLTLEHPDLIDHEGMRPPHVDPKFGRGRDDFDWDQKPPVLMGDDGQARKRETAEQQKREKAEQENDDSRKRLIRERQRDTKLRLKKHKDGT